MEKTIVNINNKVLAEIKWFTYYNGKKGFRLIDPEDGMPLMRVTLNIDDVKTEEDDIIIKDYAENHGIYGALVSCGFILKAHKKIRLGFNTVYLCKLNENYKSPEYHEQK